MLKLLLVLKLPPKELVEPPNPPKELVEPPKPPKPELLETVVPEPPEPPGPLDMVPVWAVLI